MLDVGAKAPAFSLPDQDGKKVTLKAFAGKNLVVYFYPKDLTPGCTTEAIEFHKAAKELARRNAAVVGVSKDSVESHAKFAGKIGCAFPLLSDPDGTVVEAYGAWGEKNLYGKKSMGIIRTTVIIGADGKVKKIFPKVRVDGHVAKVLEALGELEE